MHEDTEDCPNALYTRAILRLRPSQQGRVSEHASPSDPQALPLSEKEPDPQPSAVGVARNTKTDVKQTRMMDDCFDEFMMALLILAFAIGHHPLR